MGLRLLELVHTALSSRSAALRRELGVALSPHIHERSGGIDTDRLELHVLLTGSTGSAAATGAAFPWTANDIWRRQLDTGLGPGARASSSKTTAAGSAQQHEASRERAHFQARRDARPDAFETQSVTT